MKARAAFKTWCGLGGATTRLGRPVGRLIPDKPSAQSGNSKVQCAAGAPKFGVRFSRPVQQSAILRLLSACGQVGADRPPLQQSLPADAVCQARDHRMGRRSDRADHCEDATHGWFAIPAGVALVGYAGYRLRSRRQPCLQGVSRCSLQPGSAHPRFASIRPLGGQRPCRAGRRRPAGSLTRPGPRPPPGWRFWVPGAQAPVGERNTRSIPQDVKIAVSARDGGRCRQCGSTTDLHFDHVIPWSKGGANTVANIQLLCGPCNRRKGADDIPVGI